MAENAVNLVLDRLVPFLTEEAKLLKNVTKEIKSVTNELDYIRVFLRDADERAETDELVKIWVKQVRQVAFRMEAVLDEFHLRIAQPPPQTGVIGWVHKTFGFIKRFRSRHALATEMKDIKSDLDEINQRKDKYQFRSSKSSSESEQESSSSSTTGAWNSREDDALYVEESELVGIEKNRNKLVSWLIGGEERRMVFAVVGTGGVGKTTLVRKAYHSDRVTSHFQCHAWITVSQSFKIDALLVKLTKQLHESRKESIPQGMNAMDRTQLIDQLRDYLREKRYVVILDDVWSVYLWNCLKHALLDNHGGSRIMLTTRTNDVASSSVESNTHVCHLDPLLDQDALDLFHKKTFRDSRGLCPLELEECSKKIVKRSRGLPLAIVAMAGLLLTKEKTLLEWKKFYDSLSTKLGEDPGLATIMKIISLSYHDLPYYLKPCFLYFGVCSEYRKILMSTLLSLWIAEGFVKQRKGQTLEEVAKDYLDHLVNQSLVQVIHGKHEDLFKVHDLMHEFILSRMEEENFCKVLNGNSTANSHESSRRLSIQKNAGRESVMESTNSLSLVRSLFVRQFDELPKSLMHTLLSNSMHLRILDLHKVPLENFPNEITNLFHLRYLNLNYTRIRVLPNTLSRLQNLETLRFYKTNVVELPPAILKLLKLRVIIASKAGSPPSVKIPSGIGCLTALQTLAFVDVSQSETIITDLGKLTQLRWLGVANFKIQSVANLCTSISKMNLLSRLGVASFEDEVLDMQFVSSPPSLLQLLELRGRLEKLPGWIPSLSYLMKINLKCSRLMHDPLKVLQGLPNLRHIVLSNHAYDGEELHFVAEGFHKLKSLNLSELDRLNSVTIEKDALPVLIEMVIRNCEQLKQVPKGIQHVASLKTLELTGMPRELTQRLSQDGGEDYWKVKHVPKVFLHSTE